MLRVNDGGEDGQPRRARQPHVLRDLLHPGHRCPSLQPSPAVTAQATAPRQLNQRKRLRAGRRPRRGRPRAQARNEAGKEWSCRRVWQKRLRFGRAPPIQGSVTPALDRGRPPRRPAKYRHCRHDG
jgi:hypothetical protein